ncbi:MAG TPA: aspartyl protease family protein [Bacteroidales bacterium]|nr:aspartyl protease family protein [Bacteroidales bacterium]
MTETKKSWYKIKLNLLEIDGGGTHIAVRCIINGKKSVLLVDTGASNSVFDSESDIFDGAEMETVNDNGMGSGFNSDLPQLVRGKIDSIKWGRMEIRNMTVFFTPMNHINHLYKRLKLPRITGILGSDLLLEYNAIIDFGNSIVLFEKK